MVIIGMLFNPIPQPEAFHNFADQRSWLGITNAWNVLSNILFAFTGVWGLFLLFTPGKLKFIDNRERWLWIAVSIGLLLTAIGSSYYHLAPNNFRLVFDRLPMTFVFMSYAAALISERINITLGLCLWPLLAFLGFVSVLYWHATEWRGAGDLRFYLGIQLFAILTTLVMLLTPSHYTRAWDLAIVILLYGAAILVERLDHQIYMFTGNFISGHTLKHLLAGLAGLWLIRMISTRKIIIHDSKKGI
jgi:hypothetical protein